MTIQGNFKPSSLPPLSPTTRSTGRPSATAANPVRTTPAETTTPTPAAPAGLLGNHIDTTA